MEIEERHFYPLVEEKLKTLGKVTRTYMHKKGDFIPDFVIEIENGKRIAVEVGCEVHERHLVPRILSRKAFQLLVYLNRFDQVLYIAPYEELKIVCYMLEQVGVKPGEKLQTADLGYIAGAEALESKLQEIALELKKVKKGLKELEYLDR